MLNKQNISFNKREFVRYYGKTNKFHDYFTITTSFSSREVKGDMHEVLTKGSFLTSPRLANDIKHFWLRWEVPAHILKKLKMARKDHGIDFVVQHNDGTFSIGQCKFRSDKDNNTVKGDIDSFLAEYDLLNKKLIRNKYLVTTTQDVKDYLKQSDGLYVLAYSDLCDVVDMPKVLAWMEDRKLAYISRKRAKITIRATKAAVNHFAKYDKGNMLIFCGGRKTLTSLDISVLVALGATVARSKYGNKAKICFGVPSINLITQTLDVWAADLTARGVKFSYRIVCSDPSADQTDVVENMSVGVFDKDEASKWINDGANELKIVFTTFNSAEKAGELCEYDFTVVDEAHDTASRADSYKSYIVGDAFKSKKKLFQTATAKVINTTKEGYFSMDNEQQYGKCFCRVGYSELVKEGIILPLQLVLLSSEKYNNLSEELREEIENNVYYKDGLANNIPAKDLRVVALLNIFMADTKNATHFIAGYNSNPRAREMADYMAKTMDPSIKIFNVDGTMTMRERKQILEEFENAERAIITNCRCLGVGISINKVSGVVMGDPMKSKINISQFAGRASRLYDGKKFGFIIIPVESKHFLKGELESDEGYQTAVCLLATMIANDPWLKTIAMARWGNGKKNGKVARVQKEVGADEEIFDVLVPDELKKSVCYEHIKPAVVRRLNRAGLWVEITKQEFEYYKKNKYSLLDICKEQGCNGIVVDARCKKYFGVGYSQWSGVNYIPTDQGTPQEWLQYIINTGITSRLEWKLDKNKPVHFPKSDSVIVKDPTIMAYLKSKFRADWTAVKKWLDLNPDVDSIAAYENHPNKPKNFYKKIPKAKVYFNEFKQYLENKKTKFSDIDLFEFCKKNNLKNPNEFNKFKNKPVGFPHIARCSDIEEYPKTFKYFDSFKPTDDELIEIVALFPIYTITSFVKWKNRPDNFPFTKKIKTSHPKLYNFIITRKCPYPNRQPARGFGWNGIDIL